MKNKGSSIKEESFLPYELIPNFLFKEENQYKEGGDVGRDGEEDEGKEKANGLKREK